MTRLQTNDSMRAVPDEPAKTCWTFSDLTDPMLVAVAASGADMDPDALRWLGYADQELTRLREAAGLDVRPAYAGGRPQYGEA